jgi:uncharacterized protein YndB with AHSA1/START domain
MEPVRQCVTVGLPIEAVFSFVSDPRNDARWQVDLVRHEGLPETVITGSEWIEVRRMGSRETAVRLTVTAFDPPRAVRFTGDAGNVRADGAITFEPLGAGTRVCQEMRFHGRGLFRMLVPLIARQSRSGIEQNLNRLQQELARPGS